MKMTLPPSPFCLCLRACYRRFLVLYIIFTLSAPILPVTAHRADRPLPPRPSLSPPNPTWVARPYDAVAGVVFAVATTRRNAFAETIKAGDVLETREVRSAVVFGF